MSHAAVEHLDVWEESNGGFSETLRGIGDPVCREQRVVSHVADEGLAAGKGYRGPAGGRILLSVDNVPFAT